MLRLFLKSRARCLELALLVTLLNLLLSFTVVWYSNTPAANSRTSVRETRQLLSVDYTEDSAQASESPVSEPVLGTTPSGNTLDDDLKVENNGVISETHKTLSDLSNLTFVASPGVLDKFNKFQSHMFSVMGEAWSVLSSSRALCLGAHTSVDLLYELVELIKNWSGPMSIAVFVPDIELAVGLRYIQYLRSCNPAIERQVSFHLIYPVEHQGAIYYPDLEGLGEVEGNMDCKQPKQVLKFLLNFRSKEMLAWRESFPYPQNLLMNLAKNGCQTNYTFIPDIDMLPTPGMDIQLEAFLKRQDVKNDCFKCAYVIPTYEISTNSTHLPSSKTELLQFVKDKQARQFKMMRYNIKQRSSNLRMWEKIPETEEIDIAYKVEKYIYKYEPLYIARGDTPAFDERFFGFGLTRNFQVYEMYVAGYSFYLLNNAFTNHWGFGNRFPSDKTWPLWRWRQQTMNTARFDEFAKEVSARYNADPYKMLDQLKKKNLKQVRVRVNWHPEFKHLNTPPPPQSNVRVVYETTNAYETTTVLNF